VSESANRFGDKTRVRTQNTQNKQTNKHNVSEKNENIQFQQQMAFTNGIPLTAYTIYFLLMATSLPGLGATEVLKAANRAMELGSASVQRGTSRRENGNDIVYSAEIM
jgi:hypothetical protein